MSGKMDVLVYPTSTIITPMEVDRRICGCKILHIRRQSLQSKLKAWQIAVSLLFTTGDRRVLLYGTVGKFPFKLISRK